LQKDPHCCTPHVSRVRVMKFASCLEIRRQDVKNPRAHRCKSNFAGHWNSIERKIRLGRMYWRSKARAKRRSNWFSLYTLTCPASVLCAVTFCQSSCYQFNGSSHLHPLCCSAHFNDTISRFLRKLQGSIISQRRKSRPPRRKISQRRKYNYITYPLSASSSIK